MTWELLFEKRGKEERSTMNLTKMTILVLAVLLASVIVHAFYLHQGPLKKIDNENLFSLEQVFE